MTETFREAGAKLYEALSDDSDPAWLDVIVVEAARIADRLSQLHELLAGDEAVWLRLATGRDGDLEIRVDGALQESRQQATVLRQLLAEIRRHKGGAVAEDPADDDLAGL